MFLRPLLIAALILLVGHTTYAEEGIPAGFAPGTIWLSESNLVAGKEVNISSVIYDSSPSAIDGTLVFMVDGIQISDSPFVLEAGASSIKSTPWKAIQGTHLISASITSSTDHQSKNSISIMQAGTPTITVIVQPAPPKPEILQIVDRAQNIAIAATPVIQNFVNQTAGVTENTRVSAASYFSELADNPSSSTGFVLGTSTERNNIPNNQNNTLVRSAAKVGESIFSYPALFYPLLFMLLVFIFWLTAKKLKG